MGIAAGLPVNYSNDAYFYPDNTGVLGSFTKSQDAQTQVSLDYTSIIPTGLTILSASFVINYGTAPQLVISGATVQGSGEIIGFMVSGGLNGVKYTIQILAKLSDGATVLQHTLEVVVSTPGVNTPAVSAASSPATPVLPIPAAFQQGQILNGDGTKFGSSFVVYYVSDTAPTTANILDRWYNTVDGLIYDYATDGVSVFWVSSSMRPAAYTTGPTAPTDNRMGDMWYDTGNNVLKVWMNTGSGPVWYTI